MASSRTNGRTLADAEGGGTLPGLRGGALAAAVLEAGGERRRLPARSQLVREDEPSEAVFVALSGWMHGYRILPDGRRRILEFVLPGDLAGTPSPGGRCAWSVEAITDAEAAALPLAGLPGLLALAPDALLDAAHRALAAAYDGLTDAGRRTAAEAVAHFLLRISDRAREAPGLRDDGPDLVPLTQEHVGDAVGLTAVHVCRTLRRLRDHGAVETGRGWIRVVDRERLAAAARAPRRRAPVQAAGAFREGGRSRPAGRTANGRP